ncbi:efflux transporter outer membrane subunit [Glaciimonas sp. PCH181]|uniref:efflux transporter outer membrane subunit n=1 Tax=Glaciimonas sp. PCH181 TaxID=2133943 RepID=UPI000D3B9A40|nr:efflux transporter outer membrane subunit [Glaciimonas sp. PCH181]PUA19853.1 transporter [Glaciimonas sp. PCH181]
MNLTTCTASLFLALLSSGCSIAPQPSPASSLQMPAGWRTHASPSAAVDVQWWKVFGDPILNALEDLARTRNADLRMARAQVQEYQARVRIAAAGQLPSVTAGFTPGRSRALNAFGTPSDTTVYQGSLQASYEVDLWGRLESLTDATRADYEGQQAAAGATALVVAANVASGYLNLRGLDAQLDLARATLKSRQGSLDLTRKEFEVGYSSRLEWAQAQAEYRATAAAIPQLQRAIAQQENALSILIGDNPAAIARGPALTALAPPPVTAWLPSQLLRRRPDIFQAERAVVAADANLAAARDQLLPSVNLAASAGVAAFSMSQLAQSPFFLWSIGGSILAPIFEGGRLRAQTDIAASERDRAVFAYEIVVRTAFAEVENGLDSVQRLGEQTTEAQEQQIAAAEALRIARNRYRSGYASYLEELDAQRTSYSADVNLLQLRTSLLIAHVNLYRAMGGGWISPSENKATTGQESDRSRTRLIKY